MGHVPWVTMYKNVEKHLCFCRWKELRKKFFPELNSNTSSFVFWDIWSDALKCTNWHVPIFSTVLKMKEKWKSTCYFFTVQPWNPASLKFILDHISSKRRNWIYSSPKNSWEVGWSSKYRKGERTQRVETWSEVKEFFHVPNDMGGI